MSLQTIAEPAAGSSAAGPVVVLAALDRELAVLAAVTRVERRWTTSRFRAVLGRLDGMSVILARTGDGAENATRGANELLSRLPVQSVIVVGMAGGLSPSLAPGTLLVAREVIDEGGPVPPPDPAWLGRALRLTGALPATFLSTRETLCTPRAKAEAYAHLPRGTVASVDLETAAYARVAQQRGIPYLALRSVSEAADEPLPMDFNAVRDGRGSVDTRRVVLGVFRRPSLLAPLWRLRGRAMLCSQSLAKAVQALLSGDTR